MFGFIKQIIITYLGFGGTLLTKYISSNNQPYMASELCQRLCHYTFIITLGRCDIIYNTIGNPYARARVPNKVKNINVKLFNMITDINESKTLIKHISCDSRCKFDSRKRNSEQKWNNNKC